MTSLLPGQTRLEPLLHMLSAPEVMHCHTSSRYVWSTCDRLIICNGAQELVVVPLLGGWVGSSIGYPLPVSTTMEGNGFMRYLPSFALSNPLPHPLPLTTFLGYSDPVMDTLCVTAGYSLAGRPSSIL